MTMKTTMMVGGEAEEWGSQKQSPEMKSLPSSVTMRGGKIVGEEKCGVDCSIFVSATC